MTSCKYSVKLAGTVLRFKRCGDESDINRRVAGGSLFRSEKM